MKKFLIRTLSGAVYVLIVVGAIYAGALLEKCGMDNSWQALRCGNLIFSAVMFVVGLVGIHEVVGNLAHKGIVCNRTMAYLVGILTFVLVHVSNASYPYIEFIWTGHYAMLLPALWLSVFVVQLWRSDEHPFATAGYTLLPSVWVMLPLAVMCDLHWTSSSLIMMVFIFIWVNDSFAYMTGMLLGRHKMWERHSPNKTWEGTVGGMLFCVAAALLVAPLFDPGFEAYGWWLWVAISLICSVVGTLGDLVESMFKRYCGVKDSGNIMPGHGGILDRFDSLLTAAPFVEAFLIIVNS